MYLGTVISTALPFNYPEFALRIITHDDHRYTVISDQSQLTPLEGKELFRIRLPIVRTDVYANHHRELRVTLVAVQELQLPIRDTLNLFSTSSLNEI